MKNKDLDYLGIYLRKSSLSNEYVKRDKKNKIKNYICPKCGNIVKILNLDEDDNKNLIIVCKKCNLYMIGDIIV